LLRYRAVIPVPTNERQALEREREELPGQIATYQAELDATLPEHTARRERFMWQTGGFTNECRRLRLGSLGTRPIWQTCFNE
jgi:hypothetical protein